MKLHRSHLDIGEKKVREDGLIKNVLQMYIQCREKSFPPCFKGIAQSNFNRREVENVHNFDSSLVDENYPDLL